MSMFDSLKYHKINKFDRYIQICAPSLVPILVEIVDNIEDLGEETERGVGGFGSTGR
jgi:dUTPase